MDFVDNCSQDDEDDIIEDSVIPSALSPTREIIPPSVATAKTSPDQSGLCSASPAEPSPIVISSKGKEADDDENSEADAVEDPRPLKVQARRKTSLPGRKRITKSMRAGLEMPVARVHTGLRIKSTPATKSSASDDDEEDDDAKVSIKPLRIAQVASIEMTAALEVVVRTLLQRSFAKLSGLCGEAKRIEAEHVEAVLEEDEDIVELRENLEEHKAKDCNNPSSSSSSSSSSGSPVSGPAGSKKRHRDGTPGKADKTDKSEPKRKKPSSSKGFEAKQKRMQQIRLMIADDADPSPPATPSSSSSSSSATVAVASPQASGKKDQQRGKWEYFDNGWNPYSPPASEVLEDEWQEYASNAHRRDVRSVKSGNFRYFVDFTLMKQTNVDHANHTQRDIRRVVS